MSRACVVGIDILWLFAISARTTTGKPSFARAQILSEKINQSANSQKWPRHFHTSIQTFQFAAVVAQRPGDGNYAREYARLAQSFDR